MNCKTCGGTTTAKNTSRGQAFECNQDNGECYGNNGYPTTTWAQQRGFPRRAPAQRQPAGASSSDPRGAEIKWQTCLKAAGMALSGHVTDGNMGIVLDLARKLYLAPIPKPPTPKPAPEPPEEEGQVF